MRGWALWIALAVVVGAALVIGAVRSSGTPSPAQRAASIATEVRCPVCNGESAEVSDAPAAAAVRTFILQQVRAGQSKGAIEQELVDRYGTDITLVPPASGVAGLVWALPVIALVIALGGLTFAFRRWRLMTDLPLTDGDRERVERERVEGVAPPGEVVAREGDVAAGERE